MQKSNLNNQYFLAFTIFFEKNLVGKDFMKFNNIKLINSI